MAKKQMSEKALFLIVGGLLLLLMVYNKGVFERTEKPMFDGQQNYFELTLVDKAPRAETGDIYWVDVKIDNPEDMNASMYVQCSILDRAIHQDWLVGTQSITILPEADNCVDDEPFTQTAYVSLPALGFEETQFSFAVPEMGEDADPVLVCEAFEQCYNESVDTMASDLILEAITVWPQDTLDENNNANIGDNWCVESVDCADESWINLQTCVNGYCMDIWDAKNLDVSLPDLSDEALSAWFADNTVIAIIGACILIILGLTIVYKEPKRY